MSEPEDDDPDFIVLDRQCEDFAQCVWSLRRVLGEVLGADFGKWATSAERGRFLVLTPAAPSIEEKFVYIDDPEELVPHVHATGRALALALGRAPKGKIMVTPDLHERLIALSAIDLLEPP